MSENENQTPETVQNEKDTAITGLLDSIAQRIKESNPEVMQRWQDAQVEKEVSARVDLLDKGMQRRFQCLTELNKVNRPDVEHYDEAGKPSAGHYTKERIKAIKEAKEALGKATNALLEALTKNNWQKLKELKG